jgi:hypothetical protein
LEKVQMTSPKRKRDESPERKRDESPERKRDESPKRKRDELEPELLCSICLELLVEPQSLQCGHCFCLLCLCRRVKQQCPICNAVDFSQTPNVPLRNIIQKLYPEEYQTRLATRAKMTEEEWCKWMKARFNQKTVLFLKNPFGIAMMDTNALCVLGDMLSTDCQTTNSTTPIHERLPCVSMVIYHNPQPETVQISSKFAVCVQIGKVCFLLQSQCCNGDGSCSKKNSK